MAADNVSKCQLVRRPWIWLLRVRHRKGYGVHSPSAYAFLRGVVYESGTYYAYAELDRLHPWWQRWLHLYPVRCRRLLFRLANYVHPSTILILGERPMEEAYMRAAVPSAKIEKLCPISPIGPISPRGPIDLLFVAREALSQLTLPLPPMAENGMLIVEGIHADAAARDRWRAIQQDPQTVITYDLYTYGLVFFDSTKYPQHYIVNF